MGTGTGQNPLQTKDFKRVVLSLQGVQSRLSQNAGSLEAPALSRTQSRVQRKNCRRRSADTMGYWGKPIWKIAFQEAKKHWFLMIGFSVTGAMVLKLSLGLTPEQAENSAFVKLHRSDHH